MECVKHTPHAIVGMKEPDNSRNRTKSINRTNERVTGMLDKSMFVQLTAENGNLVVVVAGR